MDGSTIHDGDAKRLRELSDIWSSGDTYDDIVDQLFTSLMAPANVSGDGDKDELEGHKNSADVFFAESGVDQLKGQDGDTTFLS